MQNAGDFIHLLMLNTDVICREIEGAYAVWLKPSGKFLLLEEPAWYVVSLYAELMPANEIAKCCSNRYGLEYTHCEQFVEDAIDILESALSLNLTEDQLTEHERIELTHWKFDPIDKKMYEIGGGNFSFSYHTARTKESIHPILAHLEIKTDNTANHYFELFENGDRMIIRVDGVVTDHVLVSELGYLKASLLLQLTGKIHDLDMGDWMMTIHASAVTDGNGSIIFPAQAGSGKSTLAALLMAKGYSVISDDFIAVSLNSKHVFGLPAAITIKDGSLAVLAKYFPELTTKSSERAYTGKMVRYIPLYADPNIEQKGYSSKYFIFVNYSSEKKFLFEKINRKDAIQILLSETWINPVEENVRLFFDWITTIDFYRLTYHDEQDAFPIISKLFRS